MGMLNSLGIYHQERRTSLLMGREESQEMPAEIRESLSKKVSYVNNGGIKNQEGITSLIQGVNGNNNQETVKNDKSKLSEAGTKSSVQHISAEPEEKELVDQNKDLKTAEKVEKKQYPIGLAITLVIVGIAAAGYWCGKRVFKKK